jgi:hypothetical protein
VELARELNTKYARTIRTMFALPSEATIVKGEVQERCCSYTRNMRL